MYLQYFALTRYPFQTMEHPDELFKSKAASETETRLLHLLELRGIGLLLFPGLIRWNPVFFARTIP